MLSKSPRARCGLAPDEVNSLCVLAHEEGAPSSALSMSLTRPWADLGCKCEGIMGVSASWSQSQCTERVARIWTIRMTRIVWQRQATRPCIAANSTPPQAAIEVSVAEAGPENTDSPGGPPQKNA